MRVLIADDHALMREGLRKILEGAECIVVAEAATGSEAVLLAERHAPDLVLMDISMPGLGGIEATRQILAQRGTARILGLSMHADRRYVAAFLNAGAHGYVTKDSGSSELLQAISEVAAGGRYLNPRLGDVGEAGAPLGAAAEPASLRPFSPREREVLQLIAEGKSSKEIALSLGISLLTIETHRRNIMDKAGVRSVAELTKLAIRQGLTSLDPQGS